MVQNREEMIQNIYRNVQHPAVRRWLWEEILITSMVGGNFEHFITSVWVVMEVNYGYSKQSLQTEVWQYIEKWGE